MREGVEVRAHGEPCRAVSNTGAIGAAHGYPPNPTGPLSQVLLLFDKIFKSQSHFQLL